MSEVESMLLEIGKKLGRTPEQMQPFVQKIVNEQWLETKESLRSLNEEQWRQLCLPLRLETFMKEAINTEIPASENSLLETSKLLSAASSNSQMVSSSDASHLSSSCVALTSSSIPLSSVSPPSSLQAVTPILKNARIGENEAEKDNIKQPEDTSHVDYTAKNVENLFPYSLTDSIEALQLEVPRCKIGGVLDTLFQIIHGILNSPTNPKKRRIRKANSKFHENVGQYESALKILKAIGFDEEEIIVDAETETKDQVFIMHTAYIARLTDCHHILAELATHENVETPKLPTSGFNPYTSSIFSSSGNPFSKVSEKIAKHTEDERNALHGAIKEREMLLETGGSYGPVDLNPSICTLEEMRMQDKRDFKAKGVCCNDCFDNVNDSDNKKGGLTADEIVQIKECMGDGPLFKSRMKQKLENLQKRTIFSSCTVRVLFPDRTVLQLNFRPDDTLLYVKKQIESFLISEIRDCEGSWFLCETPPLRRFNLKKTLYQENLVPKCMIHFRLEDPSRLSNMQYVDRESLKMSMETKF